MSQEVFENVKYLSQFAENLLSKVNCHIYKNVEDYMDKACVENKLHKIKKPFFFLTALDDPIMGSTIPVEFINENILIGQTKYGGHCGYF